MVAAAAADAWLAATATAADAWAKATATGLGFLISLKNIAKTIAFPKKPK